MSTYPRHHKATNMTQIDATTFSSLTVKECLQLKYAVERVYPHGNQRWQSMACRPEEARRVLPRMLADADRIERKAAGIKTWS